MGLAVSQCARQAKTSVTAGASARETQALWVDEEREGSIDLLCSRNGPSLNRRRTFSLLSNEAAWTFTTSWGLMGESSRLSGFVPQSHLCEMSSDAGAWPPCWAHHAQGWPLHPSTGDCRGRGLYLGEIVELYL